MNTKRFVVKLVIKSIIFLIMSIIALNLLTNPIITNELALGQMENSNELYLLMEFYNKVRQLISIVYGLIAAFFVGTTIYDTYKFINN